MDALHHDVASAHARAGLIAVLALAAGLGSARFAGFGSMEVQNAAISRNRPKDDLHRWGRIRRVFDPSVIFVMLKQPRFVIAVRDLVRSADFYRDVLGFSIEWKEVPGWRLFRRDACTIMAGECPATPPARDLGEHSYMAYFEVDDVTSLHTDLAARGAQMVKALRTEPWGMREFGIETIDGHRMMFGEDVSGTA